jgi:hypothetical protein
MRVFHEGTSMSESTVVRKHLDRLVADLLEKGLSSAWIGLELLTVGIGLLTRIIGSRQMAEHLRCIATQLDGREGSNDPGYSAHG